MGKTITAVFQCLSAISVNGFFTLSLRWVLLVAVLSIVFRKFVSDKMKSRAGTRRWSSYAPLNYLKAYAGDGVKSGEAVHLDS